MKKQLIAALAALAIALFAGCEKNDNVTPILETVTVVSLPHDGGGKYAYNGRTQTYTFSSGDSIFIGTQAYGLNIVNPTTAMVVGGPRTCSQNTILFPAQYVSRTDDGGNIYINVPDRHTFAPYGEWSDNLYCPYRCYSVSGTRVTLAQVLQIADWYVTMPEASAEAYGIEGDVHIDSILLIAAMPVNGETKLRYGSVTTYSGSNTTVFLPHDTASATVIPGRKEAVLGYAVFTGGTTVAVHWHADGESHVSTYRVNKTVTADRNNTYHCTANINL